MTWLWAIFFSFSAFGFSALPLFSATVTGKVELRDSREPEVRKKQDYSGVVISLVPMATAAEDWKPARATMLQKNKTFSPHVLAVTAGTTVDFPNADPIFHNAFSSYSGQIFDIGLYPPGSTKSVQFKRPGVVRVFCNIHSSMSAMIVVLPTPYFAVTRRDGRFTIPDVPQGDYKVQVFHERASEATLRGLERRIAVGQDPVMLPAIEISEAGYLPIPHVNKYGHAYPAEPDDRSVYPAVRK
jgi:plastocyanin